MPVPPLRHATRENYFLFPASRPSPPAPCQINRGSPSIEQSCHKQDRSSSVPSPGSAYIPTGHFRIPSRHAAQRAFTMRHGNRNRQRIHPVKANCQSHEEGASNRQDRTAHTGSHTFLTTQLSRHERHEERPPFIADFPKRFRNYKSWEPVPSAGDIPSASRTASMTPCFPAPSAEAPFEFPEPSFPHNPGAVPCKSR